MRSWRSHHACRISLNNRLRLSIVGSYRSCCSAAASATVAAGTSSASPSSHEASAAAAAADAQPDHAKFYFRPRIGYAPLFRATSLSDYISCTADNAYMVTHTYRRQRDDTVVTLIPLRHMAHPLFFKQVDDLCCQHQSVLMEGRVPLTYAPYSTMVPPRESVKRVRPVEHDDEEGWEPNDVMAFFQPFSWGVKDSPYFTVVHASDKYDYERLPWWCSLRFNFPILGSLAREKHCLGMLEPLRQLGYKSFAVPWGAAHMPIFHEMLIDNGFERIGMASIILFSRIDGDISAGEHHKIYAWHRRREWRGTVLQGLAIVSILYMCRRQTVIDHRSGPRLE